MIQDKTPPHIKFDERKYVEKPLLSHLDRLGWDITALLNDTEVASL